MESSSNGDRYGRTMIFIISPTESLLPFASIFVRPLLNTSTWSPVFTKIALFLEGGISTHLPSLKNSRPGTWSSWSNRMMPHASICSLSPLTSSRCGHLGYLATFVPMLSPLLQENASFMLSLTDPSSLEKFGIFLMLEMGRCQMKKALSQSVSECIGATTLDEYMKHIGEMIPARLRERYEIHHKLRHTNEALVVTAQLSYQYIRFLNLGSYNGLHKEQKLLSACLSCEAHSSRIVGNTFVFIELERTTRDM
ncbi:hypothetical protein CR513_30768, partial [Mucuna pruriens]